MTVPFEPGLEGLFDLPNAIYQDNLKSPGIRKSHIMELVQMSAAHLKTVLDGTHTKTVTKQMVGGSLIDLALLEPDKFKEGVSHWTIPAGMKLSTTGGIAWKKDHPDLPYLPAESDAGAVVSAQDVQGMIASALAHKKVRFIVESSKKQESAFCFDPATNLMRKVRPDAKTLDRGSHLVLADLKSTFRGGATDGAWRNQCARLGYHIQDSFYSDVYKDLLGEMPFFIFIVVERKPPYACRLFQVDPDGKAHARNRWKQAMAKIRQCQDTGVWPAYDEDIQVVSLPGWEIRAPEPESIEL